MQSVVEGYSTHAELSKLLASLSVSGSAGHFSLNNRVMKYKNRIWLAHNVEAQHKLLQALHASPIGGHSGIHVTYTRVKNLFAWPGLKKMVQEFVSNS